MIAIRAMLVILACNGFVYAQVYKTDYLRNYQSPNFKYALWQIGGSSRPETLDNIFILSLRDNDRSLSAGLSTFFYSEKFSRKYIGTNSIFIGGSSFFRDRTLPTNVSNSKRFGAGFEWSGYNRFYSKNRFFSGLHFNNQISWINQETKVTLPFNVENKVQGVDLTGILVFSAGYGILEPLNYARRALDIERVFLKENLIEGPLSKNDMDRLSHTITQALNIRVFDQRKRRIKILEMVDNSLQDLDPGITPNAKYYGNLFDLLNYNAINDRTVGRRHEFGLSNAGAYSINIIDTLNNQFSGSGSNYFFYDFTNDFPINYAWQSTTKTSLVYGQLSGIAYYGGLISHALGFYPTTRTKVALNTRIASSYHNELGFTGSLGLSGYYYLSPQFRVQLSCAVVRDEEFVDTGINTTMINYGASRLMVNNSLRFDFSLNYQIF